MTTPKTLTEAFPNALFATSIALDYTDRAGERQSAHYSGDGAFQRAAKGLRTLRERHATAVTVTAWWGGDERTATLAD